MAEISGPEFAYLVVHLGVWVLGDPADLAASLT